MKHYLAADSGGSKTKFCVFDESSALIEEYSALGAGAAIDSDEDIPHISAVLNEIAEKYNIASASVNLGGKNTEQIKKIFSKCLKTDNVNVFRESDATAALALGKMKGAEVVLLAGTGAIAVATDNAGNFSLAGGWGPNISDDGSGYSIGLAAIRESLMALDGSKQLTLMQKAITGLDKPFSKQASVQTVRDARDSVRAKLSPLDRKNIASVCKTVEDFCKLGEPDALEIYKRAGEDLGRLIVETQNKLAPYKSKGVAVAGGLVKAKEFWTPYFEEYIKKNSEINEFFYEADGVMLATNEIAKIDFLKIKGEN